MSGAPPIVHLVRPSDPNPLLARRSGQRAQQALISSSRTRVVQIIRIHDKVIKSCTADFERSVPARVSDRISSGSQRLAMVGKRQRHQASPGQPALDPVEDYRLLKLGATRRRAYEGGR